ncbi:MAG TPA: IS21 family transposase [Acidimicrobiales bacterium]|nr:IS21 family transposase [Acidimicrobiales bacterium]
MLSKEKQMDVLEAYDLTKSLRAAAELAGTDHHTVARYVAARAAGMAIEEMAAERPKHSDGFAEKIAEWVERSNAKVRADVVHERLVAMGYTGSERTTRRVVAVLKASYRHANHRIYRPWIPEPGLWLQYDFGDGPVVEGVHTVLFCAWLAWSRFRVVLPLTDRTMGSVVGALNRTFRLIGGASTYVLTDNEKTVTDRHIAGIPVRNESMVATANYYGVTICTCVPYDPESKGGSESTVKIAKADLVPTEANLLDAYESFAELEVACGSAMDTFNGRIHAVTRRIPAEALVEERSLLHAIPDAPYTAAFGESRRVGWSSTISFRGVRYSVPHRFCDTRVWVRQGAGEVIIVAGEGPAAIEVARHQALSPGGSSICEEHYPERRSEPRERRPRPTSRSEERFLALGEGAKRYLIEGAASGARRLEARMSEAVCLAALHGVGPVDEALGLAAMAGRFWEGDLESILVHAAGALVVRNAPPEGHSLAQGTSSWRSYGLSKNEAPHE